MRLLHWIVVGLCGAWLWAAVMILVLVYSGAVNAYSSKVSQAATMGVGQYAVDMINWVIKVFW